MTQDEVLINQGKYLDAKYEHYAERVRATGVEPIQDNVHALMRADDEAIFLEIMQKK